MVYVEKKRIAENGGVKSADLSTTSPVANYEIKEHYGNGKTKPKDDKNVEGPSGVKSGDLSATSPGVNAPPHSDDETEFVDIIGIDEDENKGLTAAQVLRAQLDAEEQRWNMQRASRQRQRQAQLDEQEWRRRNEQRSERQRQTSSSSSNDIESCDENSVNPIVD
ncbi:hypothetical protein HKD37_20G056523 [Glycine soja]